MNRAVFLDRDGVLNRTEVRGGKPYAPRRFEDFELYPEAAECCRRLAAAGLALIVVTNQPDVGNGKVARETVDRMHAALREKLQVREIFACYHGQAAGCTCRKPEPGMIFDAAARFGLAPRQSFMVGDRWSDIDCGKSAGCFSIFIDRGYNETLRKHPDSVVRDLPSAVDVILSRIAHQTHAEMK